MTFHAKRHCRIAHAVDDARYHFRLTAALSLMPRCDSAAMRGSAPLRAAVDGLDELGVIDALQVDGRAGAA
jgi:hypothetical protein